MLAANPSLVSIVMLVCSALTAACSSNTERDMSSMPSVQSAGHEPANASSAGVLLVRARELGEGTALLQWDPPQSGPPRAGGSASSPDDAVAGYAVYVGPSPDSLALEAVITGAQHTGYLVDKLPRGTHYFAVASFSRNGEESVKTPIASKTID